MMENTNTITLEEAQQRIQLWRDFIGESVETKAFFISGDDIKALYTQISKNDGFGVRAYLARNNSGENELLFVGTKSDAVVFNKDVIVYNNESAIYDLTTPCPNMCDTSSPLFNLPDDKEKINLSDLSKK